MVTMSHRGRKRFLWAVNLLAAAGIALSVWAALALPLAVTGEDLADGDAATKTNAEEAHHVEAPRPLADYRGIYQRDLRKPLDDPKPVEVKAPPPKPKPERKLDVTLVGTAVDPGSTYAFFQQKGGKVTMAGVGEKIDDVEVTGITDGEAVVRFDGRVITLKVPERKGP